MKENNVARKLMLHETIRQKWKQQIQVFREKERRQEENCEEIQQLHYSHATRKLYQKVNAFPKALWHNPKLCWDKDERLLTDGREVI